MTDLLAGSCHCGVVKLELATARAPADLPVRVCGCTFCLRHRPRYTSDPAGHATSRIASEAGISRYRFGLRLADFVICRTCGVFVAAYKPDLGRAVLNLEVLDRRAEFVAAPVAFAAYDAEDARTRTARHVANWTPATL